MSQHIDHSNFEAWLLDRMEGRLTPAQEAMLDAFLAAHPDLSWSVDELPALGPVDERLPRTDKDALKRTLPPTGMPADAFDDFLIARSEGDLSAEQQEALRVYLNEHPEHQRKERLYAVARILPEAAKYTAKSELTRHFPPSSMPGPHTLDDLLVARLEGDLSDDQERELVAYLDEHPEARQAWSIVQRTRVAQDPVVYAHKEELKKGAKVIALASARSSWVVRLRVAAMVAVLFGLGYWLLTRESTPDQRFAQQGDTELLPDTVERMALTADPDTLLAKGSASDTNARVTFPKVNKQGDRSVDTPGDHPGKRKEPATVPSANSGVEREHLAVLTGVAPVLNSAPIGSPVPISEPVGDAATLPVGTVHEAELYAADQGGIPLRNFLANAFRERVLDVPTPTPRPLDGNDAVAAIDKGLRTVGGDRSGLAVDRRSDGGLGGFDLRLGRNFSISAKR